MILITGATGFVGSAVLRRLLAAGHRVRALARPASVRRNLEGLTVEVVEGDLLEPSSLRPALEGCSGLFHVAADYRLWAPDPGPMFRANVDGTRMLLLAARDARVERIVYTSSVAALGVLPGDAVADEKTPVTFADMIGPYKQSKFLAEATVRKLVEDEGLPVVIVNPSTPIGPRDIKPTPTGRLIVEAAAGRMPAYVETGLNVAHVDDVAEGHLLAFEKGRVGERYILGGENMSLQAILSAVAEAAGRRAPKLKIPHGAILPIAYAAEAWARIFGGEPFATVDGVRMARKKMYFSHAKAARDLGYAPRPAGQALADAVRWFKDHGYLG
ncbi:MAG: NAD-dependent epimerase/dehydratase family protein [Rhodospirillales bacterium]|nr:NAD-dependent epimerase/dehydratase family protein [Rhodospirillales bacterium]